MVLWLVSTDPSDFSAPALNQQLRKQIHHNLPGMRELRLDGFPQFLRIEGSDSIVIIKRQRSIGVVSNGNGRKCRTAIAIWFATAMLPTA